MGRSHRPPTDAVIKALYATADRCAVPGCAEPLYKSISDAAGPVRLNSRVAHICALSEDGPRWDPAQTEADNRAPENLLLLCIEHAAEVDDHACIAQYPVSVLQGWKVEQAKQRNGRSLSEAEVRKVARRSFSSSSISISQSYVSLGGEGGRGDGAGGGGGGAMGTRAIGGPGGAGGTRFILDGTPGTGHGAGGGGGGGGAPPPRRMDWTSPDSTLSPPPSDKGRAAPVASALRVTSLLLAHRAHAHDGLLDVVGAGWEHFEAVQLPAEVAVALVCAVHMEQLDPRLQVKLTAIVRTPGNVRALEQEFFVRAGPARTVVNSTACVALRFLAREAGVWTIGVCEDDAELAWVPLEVKVRPQPEVVA
jgi:hypothetical protein